MVFKHTATEVCVEGRRAPWLTGGVRLFGFLWELLRIDGVSGYTVPWGLTQA